MGEQTFEEPQVFTIQGRVVDSKEEWFVSISLHRLGWTFRYQERAGPFGNVRGVQIIDFMVDTVPLRTPLFVDGDFWHGGPQAERDKIARDLLWILMGGRINKYKVLKGSQLPDQETSDNEVLKLFGRRN